MLGLAANPELRKKMGEAAREASRPYDIRFTVANTVALYERLCATRPDLQRSRPHGRWYRSHKGLRPRLGQLARLLFPNRGGRPLASDEWRAASDEWRVASGKDAHRPAQDRPFDATQDRPFDAAQDRPFDAAQDRHE